MAYRFLQFPLVIILIFLFSSNAFPIGKESNETMLVSTDWLAEHIDDPSVRILYVGLKDEYDEKHIPGAYLLPVMDIFDPSAELKHELAPVEMIEKTLKPLGITGSTKIVLYYDENWLTVTARAYLTLDYVGLGSQIKILDGGLAQWLNENRETTVEIPETSKSNFVLHLDNNALVDVDWVKNNLRNPDVIIIDARPEEFYTGTEKVEHVAKYGHITGAINISFEEITVEDTPYKFKSIEELEELFIESGVKPGSVVVSYCNTGVWAAVVYFTAKYLGYEAHFYDGSFEEWTMDDSLPVTEPVRIDY
ncbi:MAG: sulfurtransferase [Ignavibacteria bacterium]|jgi:thiosulfate/3-mercaptopyruvate sulfurtransferase